MIKKCRANLPAVYDTANNNKKLDTHVAWEHLRARCAKQETYMPDSIQKSFNTDQKWVAVPNELHQNLVAF